MLWPFLDASFFPTYCVVVAAIMALSFRLLRTSQRSSFVTLAAAINGSAALAAFALVCFKLSGAATTVQLNVGDDSAMNAWQLWAGLWPLFMLALAASVLTMLFAIFIFLVTHRRWTAFKSAKWAILYLLLTLLHSWFGLSWVCVNFPDA